MALSGTLKERLSQYKALKEEEARKNALSISPSQAGQSSNLEGEKAAGGSWVPKIDEESEEAPEQINDDDAQEEEYEEEVIENDGVIESDFEERSFVEDDVSADYDVASYEEQDHDHNHDTEYANEHGEIDRNHEVFRALDNSPQKIANDQDVFKALDEAERAENGLYDSRNKGVVRNNVDLALPLSNREPSVGSSGNALPPVVISEGERYEKINDADISKSGGSRGKLNCIVIGVVVIACLAIVAIVLPFVFDYPSKKTDPMPDPSTRPDAFTTSPPSEATNNVSESQSPSDSPTTTPTTLQWGQFMKTFLIPVSGEDVFQNHSSPQYRAAKYILDDPYTSQLKTTEELDDRYASVTFYYATDGENWDSCYLGDANCANGQWLVNDVCDWFAVSCNSDGRVTSYRFAAAEGNGLVGTLPPEMYLLSNMTDLVIVNNTIKGSLPQLFGENSTQLRSLLLPNNKLSGTIPANYLKNSPLEFVHLGSNKFTGSIPTNIGDGTYIQQLDLSENSLSGSIPVEVSGYGALEALSFARNKLTGSIPDDIYESLTNLKFLHLNGNKLSGTVSSLIGELQSLKELRIGVSNLGGLIPDELFTLTSLEELDISRAKFEGRLSLGFVTLGSLKKIIVNGNKLDGTVPANFGRLTSLSDLVLQGNKFTGSIPESICLLRQDNLKVLTADCEELTCECCSTCF